jgi:hypothetical protein
MALSQFQLQYQINPIFLTGGIASNIAGGMLPILSLTNSNAFDPSMLIGSPTFQLDDAFAIFQPPAGGSLVEQSVAQYPFANLAVAGNAIIRAPLNVSMIMLTPMKSPGSWGLKLSIMQALKATLDNHNNAGGTYTVCTPAYTYTDMLMVNLIDVSNSQSPMPQNAWKWDFTRPLITAAEAQAAMSNLMSQLTNGGVSTGATTSPDTALGASPNIINTGPSAGVTSPGVSQMPMTSTANLPSGITQGPSISQSPNNIFGPF